MRRTWPIGGGLDRPLRGLPQDRVASAGQRSNGGQSDTLLAAGILMIRALLLTRIPLFVAVDVVAIVLV